MIVRVISAAASLERLSLRQHKPADRSLADPSAIDSDPLPGVPEPSSLRASRILRWDFGPRPMVSFTKDPFKADDNDINGGK
jgi:hypothetical protein